MLGEPKQHHRLAFKGRACTDAGVGLDFFLSFPIFTPNRLFSTNFGRRAGNSQGESPDSPPLSRKTAAFWPWEARGCIAEVWSRHGGGRGHTVFIPVDAPYRGDGPLYEWDAAAQAWIEASGPWPHRGPTTRQPAIARAGRAIVNPAPGLAVGRRLTKERGIVACIYAARTRTRTSNKNKNGPGR